MEGGSPVEIRQKRLRNDYETMENIRRTWLDWKPVAGAAPFVEKYEISLQLRTIISPAPDYRDSHIITVTLGPAYPSSSRPSVQMLTRPPPFHPNWFTDGRYCSGQWWVYESLGAHIVRMIQTLQYDPEITDISSPANNAACHWYNVNRNRDWFPCDSTPLPDPTSALARLTKKRKFEVR